MKLKFQKIKIILSMSYLIIACGVQKHREPKYLRMLVQPWTTTYGIKCGAIGNILRNLKNIMEMSLGTCPPHLKEQLTWSLMCGLVSMEGPSHWLHDHSNIPTSWSILGPTWELGLVPNIMNNISIFFLSIVGFLFFVFSLNK
jgi:hypothetical protein